MKNFVKFSAKLPRRVVFVIGVYTIGNILVDQLYAPVT